MNTGWTGGPYGIGRRMAINHTRTLVSAALTGVLKTVSYSPHPIFQVLVPEKVPGLPTHILNPKNTWKNSTNYDQQALILAQTFIENFQQFNTVAPEIIAAGPTFNPETA